MRSSDVEPCEERSRHPGVSWASALMSRRYGASLISMAWLLARQNPTFSSLAITRTSGQRSAQQSPASRRSSRCRRPMTSSSRPGAACSRRLRQALVEQVDGVPVHDDGGDVARRARGRRRSRSAHATVRSNHRGSVELGDLPGRRRHGLPVHRDSWSSPVICTAATDPTGRRHDVDVGLEAVGERDEGDLGAVG